MDKFNEGIEIFFEKLYNIDTIFSILNKKIKLTDFFKLIQAAYGKDSDYQDNLIASFIEDKNWRIEDAFFNNNTMNLEGYLIIDISFLLKAIEEYLDDTGLKFKNLFLKMEFSDKKSDFAFTPYNGNLYIIFTISWKERRSENSLTSYFIHEMVHLLDLYKSKNKLPEPFAISNDSEDRKNFIFFKNQMSSTEINARIHEIELMKKRKAIEWDSMALIEVFQTIESIRAIYNYYNNLLARSSVAEEAKKLLLIFTKNLVTRMDREGLLGKKMRLHSSLLSDMFH